MNVRYLFAYIVAALLAQSTAGGQLMRPDPIFDPPMPETQDLAIQQKLDAQVPLDVELIDESGSRVRLADYFGDKPVVLSLVYLECPMLCGEILNGIITCVNDLDRLKLGEDYTVLSISFDPDETHELASMKKENVVGALNDAAGAKTGWHFLTGKGNGVKRIADAVGFPYEYIEETDQYAHPSGIMLLTPEGKVSSYHFGIEYPARDMRLGLVDASNNKIGSLADQLLLTCFHWDPVTGAYTLAIFKVLRMFAFVTVTAVTGLIALFIWGERRKKALESVDSAQTATV